ncbi:MAG TPA: P27 family phage terminase small subunit [Candidatus Faecousia intestinigallinarum]|nr:P27 family phage terminase small subunit [Candidatus Faecousia intestinigallinarum]
MSESWKKPKNMTEEKWRRLIVRQCKGVKTYRPEFDAPIAALAAILTERDKIYAAYIADGGRPLVWYTNKGGAENLTKNPLLSQWADFNESALKYWRELGLTPASLQKMTGGALKEGEPSGLAAALQGIDLG